MSDEQVAEQTEQPPETGVSDSEDKKDGGFVEFPNQEVEARFKRVYGHMKQYEGVVDKVTADNVKLIASNTKLEERLDKMEGAQAEKVSSDRLSKLAVEEKDAMESGDYERATAVRGQITDLRVDAKILQPKEEPEAEPWLTPERNRKITEWAGSTDEQGNLLRPWADPDHEDYETAIAAAQVLIDKNPNMDLDDLLEKIEKVNGRVTQKSTRPFASTLSGNNDVRPKPKKTPLSEDEKLIVRRMYPGDSKGAEKYASAKEKYL